MASSSTKRPSAKRPGPKRTLQLQIEIDDGDWPPEKHTEKLLAPIVETLLKEIELPRPRMAATITLATDAVVRDLNKQWRKQDKPTNVLSFPNNLDAPATKGEPVFLGDVIVARETLAREAIEQNISFDHHLSHLVLHGILHLTGYDHETDAEAEVMEALETRILTRLGLADPYAEPLNAS
jgi:probable rRNA maturation factor